MNLINKLKNIYLGKDIWVLGTGPSMNYIEQSFFNNKITIGINRICKFFNCDYIVAKDPNGFSEIIKYKSEKTKIILSEYSTGIKDSRINKIEGDHFIFPHRQNNEKIDLSVIRKDSNEIVVSQSTITSAIHIAAYMGAANIIICGHDCGTINGHSNIEGYYKGINPAQKTNYGYVNWLSEIEKNTISVKDAIKKEFSCNIYSLNPFLNLNATGYEYLSADEIFHKDISRKLLYSSIRLFNKLKKYLRVIFHLGKF